MKYKTPWGINDIKTRWKRKFIIFPKTTVSGKRIWFEFAYHRVYPEYGDMGFGHIILKVEEYGNLFDVIMHGESKNLHRDY